MNVFEAGSLPDLASEVVTIGAIGLESFVFFKCVEKLGELKVNYDESVSSSTLASSLESKIRLEITEREASLASRAAQKAEARALRLKKVEENIERTREEEERIKRNQEEALRIAKQKADALKEKEGNELKL
ncbi:hypothetical protein TL16_g13046 [Triparma laevis f. inornata]|uniref:Uncharacterized protein n=2 Tax=Triparma laevis TaxID=1534972 RepID=A0A9W7KYN4_9STRA|nr:hypothetical protein TL16_g13046 [Triparma laevis f. inornata]GMI16698.1 hypothetical protein TrLO_g13160 [Triparma laevis f. longispina]